MQVKVTWKVEESHTINISHAEYLKLLKQFKGDKKGLAIELDSMGGEAEYESVGLKGITIIKHDP